MNSLEVATELLDKRSAIYSSRARRTMVCELYVLHLPPAHRSILTSCRSMGWSFLVSAMPYGPRWKDHRTLLHKYFPLGQTNTYHPTQTKEMLKLLGNLSTSPENFLHHTRR